MPTNTINFNLVKPGQQEFYNVDVSNSNMDTIDGVLKTLQDATSSGASEQDLTTLRNALTTHLADNTGHVYYADDTGTANAKVVLLNPVPTVYKKGMGISFTNLVQNAGAATINVNGLGAKPILKSNGNAIVSGNLKANSIYTVRYNGTAFILQGEGGEYGTATVNDVLAGKTIGTEDGLKIGTIPYYAGLGFESSNIRFPPGYSDTVLDIFQPNTGYVTPGSFLEISDPDFKAHNIRKGINIFGVDGTLDAKSMGGATRLASGTVQSSSTQLPFRKITDWSNTTNAYHASVSLDFEPDLIYILWSASIDSGASNFAIYTNTHSKYTRSVIVGGASYFTTGGEGRASVFRGDTDNAYVNSTGFRLPVYMNNSLCNWIAVKF